MSTPNNSFDLPIKSKFLGENGVLSYIWEWFFREVYTRLYALGVERSFKLVNGQATAADITGLRLSKRGVSCAFVEFLVQRVTTGTGAVEQIETLKANLTYLPTSDDWNWEWTSWGAPTNSGITFSTTSTGQVQYTSTTIAGTPSISILHYRVRTLAGKNGSYSAVGAR